MMTTRSHFIPPPNASGLIKLSGTVTKLKVTRDSASFVFTKSDQTKLGVVAIAAALAGQGGQAMSAAANASDVEEQADYLEFELGGRPIKGWVWRNPFKEGDEVEVAAEQRTDHHEAFGITRPTDKLIALYPHCSRGPATHVKNAVKLWVIGGGAMVCLFLGLPRLLGSIEFSDGYGVSLIEFVSCLIAMTFFAFVTYMMTRQWMPFVRLAEKVFKALELPNPSNVDLVKSSKAQRTAEDKAEYGTFYFRY
jgi:hypothetical protein